MMPLGIFAARNFAVGNLATVFLYAAVSLGTLIVALFLQETVGLSATEAGLATLPIPVLSFLLARRFGTLAGRHRSAAVHGGRPADRRGRFSVDVDRRPSVRLLDADAARPGCVRSGPVDHGVAADGGDARRGRSGAERHRVGGQQRDLPDRRPDRDRVHRRDRRPPQSISTGFGGRALVAAALFAVAGVVSAVGIRNEQCDITRVRPEPRQLP